MGGKSPFYTLLVVVGLIVGVLANPLIQRQATSSVAPASKPSKSISSSKSAKEAATPSATASKTTSPKSTSVTVLSGTRTPSSTPVADGPAVITKFRSLPHFTETVSHAYKGHGVNATFNSTFSHKGTITTGTATELPAGAVLGAAGPQPTGKEIGDIPDDKIACRINGTNHKQGPFCTPEYDQNLWVNNIYAVTWNPDLFSPNATNHIEIHNANSTSSNPKESLIYNSTSAPNLYGFINIYMNHDFLGDLSGNYTRDGMNMTFILFSQPIGAPLNQSTGPITTLTLNPHDLPRLLLKNPIPTKKGLEIGLPIGLVALIIIALSLWCGIRRHRQKWSHMRHYGQDYLRKRARRMGKNDGIELSDYDYNGNARAERFEDEPTTGGGNQFRDELERQREEAYRNRPQKITSF